MANFFKKYPKLLYNGKLITDITARTIIQQAYADKLSIFYPYDMQEGDTPEIIAHKYYGDTEKHWLVLLANQIMDPFFDFTLTYTEFDNYLTTKYQKYSDSLIIWANDSANNWKGIWSSNTTYSQNNTVCFGNTAYVCANSHKSSVFVTDYNSKHWTKIYDGNYWKGIWQNGVYYAEQDVTQYNSTLYVCKQEHISNSNITVSDADYWKTYSNPIEYSKVTLNIDPPGYRAIITTTDISSGQETIETVFIDKKAYHSEYSGAIFDYSDITYTPMGGSQNPEDNDVIYNQTKQLVHIYDYEHELNENKRQIKLIRKEYAGKIEQELKYLMEQQYG